MEQNNFILLPSVSTNELDMSNLPEIKVFAGENSQYIAESIASSLGLELGKNRLRDLVTENSSRHSTKR